MTAVELISQSSRNTSIPGQEIAERLRRVMERGARAQWWHRRGTKEEGFWYEDAKGHRVTNEQELERIAHLAIPPGYTDVRVAPTSRSNLQAIAVDTSGRIQYRYGDVYAECQARKKFEKIEHFGEHLPKLRHVSNQHIAQEGLGKERVLAVVTRLINDLYFRLGSEGSVERYKTFGITSLRNYHLHELDESHLLFQFTGKHHIHQRRILVDGELVTLMSEIKAIGDARLFNYLDGQGNPHAITPADVNHYIKTAMGSAFSAKDFRTWGGTLQAAIALAEMGKPNSEKEIKKNIIEAAKIVADRLGNTPTVCRESYIHPVVFERYSQGITLQDFRPEAKRVIRRHHEEYTLEEVELMKLFQTQPVCS